MFPTVRLEQGVVLAGTGTAAIGALCWRHMFCYVSHWAAFQERVLIFGEGALAIRTWKHAEQRVRSWATG